MDNVEPSVEIRMQVDTCQRSMISPMNTQPNTLVTLNRTTGRVEREALAPRVSA